MLVHKGARTLTLSFMYFLKNLTKKKKKKKKKKKVGAHLIADKKSN